MFRQLKISEQQSVARPQPVEDVKERSVSVESVGEKPRLVAEPIQYEEWDGISTPPSGQQPTRSAVVQEVEIVPLACDKQEASDKPFTPPNLFLQLIFIDFNTFTPIVGEEDAEQDFGDVLSQQPVDDFRLASAAAGADVSEEAWGIGTFFAKASSGTYRQADVRHGELSSDYQRRLGSFLGKERAGS
ncbi:hypothetical protein BJ508DRAFT_316453 [Ascobolus immersus RN42]|uniref:Uncharacterized protein n=1 Tax=Ascobolus immersus RN42 TaxID=1160509 RepID=A0A3N4HE89_ASCIM|nr:hypothetical protein BJ508DRAFT_316453 [Ascobolus immersus RN42]